jgi:hypothetical protein
MKIKEIEILSDDLKGTLDFYSGGLALPVILESETILRFKAGHSILTFLKSFNVKPQYHFAFTIPENKLEEALQFISARTKIIAVPDQQLVADFFKWNAKAFYFLDNNGNIVEFIVRYDLNYTSEIPFNGKSMLSISEIGIVTEDVRSLADKLMAGEKINLFPKQERHPDFTVLGDDHGLLILVREDRDWYPTQIKSGKYYLKVLLDVSGEEKRLIFNDSNF